MKIVREDTAALVIDFQEKLVPAVAESKELMQRVQILLRGLKALDVPMIVTWNVGSGNMGGVR